MPEAEKNEIKWGEILLAIILFFFGCLLIANGACTIEWTRMGGMVVNGKKDVVTTDGATVEVATKEEEELLEKDRKGFVQAMSAINILAGLFLFALAFYFGLPNSLSLRGKITSAAASRTGLRTIYQDADGNRFSQRLDGTDRQRIIFSSPPGSS